MPSTDAAVFWAGRHILGDLEDGGDGPNALMVDAEDGQILGLDAVHVRSVGNGEGATLQVVDALQKKEMSWGFWQDERFYAETHVGYRKGGRGIKVNPGEKNERYI